MVLPIWLMREFSIAASVIRKRKSLRQIGYDNELKFWEAQLNGSGQFSESVLSAGTIEGRKKRFPEFILPHIDKLTDGFKSKLKVVEIGPGPISTLAWGVDMGFLDLFPIDPLATDFIVLLDKYLPGFPVKPIPGTGENILTYPDGLVDFAYIQNALDHSKDPEKVCNNLSRVLRKGGILALSHEYSEGTHENWQNLHQFDLFPSDGCLFLRNRWGIKKKVIKNMHENLLLEERTYLHQRHKLNSSTEKFYIFTMVYEKVFSEK